MFGWAKPVPVNVGRLRSPRNQGVLVSLAGPAINALLAAVFGLRLRPLRPPGARGHRELLDIGDQVVFCASLVNVGLCRLQHDPGAAARRVRALRAPPARALLADLPEVPPVHDARPAGARAAQFLPLSPTATAPSPGSSTTSITGGRSTCSAPGSRINVRREEPHGVGGPGVGRRRHLVGPRRPACQHGMDVGQVLLELGPASRTGPSRSHRAAATSFLRSP